MNNDYNNPPFRDPYLHISEPTLAAQLDRMYIRYTYLGLDLYTYSDSDYYSESETED